MSQTTGNLCRKIGGAGDLQSAVRRMKVVAASSIGQYDESVRTRGRLPEEKPYLIKGPLRLYFKEAASPVTVTLAQFLTQARPGDYLPLVAYIAETPLTSGRYRISAGCCRTVCISPSPWATVRASSIPMVSSTRAARTPAADYF